ncbi:MAG: hypothetical protein IKA02_04885, partial [Clostridia bacterium]|nr:hypothetical protein [Clostridia bacterium]
PELNSTVISLLIALVSVIVLPILFMVFYMVLGVLLFIPKLIVNKIIMPSTKGIGLRIGGGLIGLVTSIVSVFVLIIPIVGYVNYASDTIDMLKTEENQMESIQQIEDVVDEAKDTPIFEAVYAVGGRKLFEVLTTITVDDVTISLSHETETSISVYKETAHFINVPLNEYGEEQIQSIEKIEEIIMDADFLPAFLANAISYVAQEWNKGNAVFGIEKPVIGTELQEALDQTLIVLAETTPDKFKNDLCTVAEITKCAIEDGVVYALTSEDGDIWYVLENTDIISDILVELHRNERTRPILPAFTNGVVNYLYGIYDEVNGTTTEKHHMVDINGLNEETVKNEGKIISNVIIEIDTFFESVDGLLDGDVLEIIKNGDFAALGRAFNNIKKSYLFCDTYEFILRTVLESKGCSKLGILDEQFIKNAILHDSDMEMMLVSRQKITLLVLSMYHGEEIDYSDAIEALIVSITTTDADSIKNIITEENLNSIGVKGEHAHTISGLLTSVVNSIKDESVQIPTENIASEAESVGKIITAVDSALENEAKDKNVFASNDDKESTSSMTASEFVSTTLESELVSSMVVVATKDENGNEVDDPYNVKEHLSENDIKELEFVLGEEYASTDENDESKKEKLDAIAHIFGIDTSKFN